MRKFLLSICLAAASPVFAAPAKKPISPPLNPMLGKRHGVVDYQILTLTPKVREVLIRRRTGTDVLRAEVMGADEFAQTETTLNNVRVVTRIKQKHVFLYADGLMAEKLDKQTIDPNGLFKKYEPVLMLIGATLADLPEKTQPNVANLTSPIDCMSAENPDIPDNCSPNTGGGANGPSGSDPRSSGGGAIGTGTNSFWPTNNPANCQGAWHRGASTSGSEQTCCREAVTDVDTQCSSSEGLSGGSCCNYQPCDSWCAWGDYGCMCGINGRSKR